MRVAQIDKGKVVNVLEVDAVSAGLIQSDTANIGDSYAGGIFTSPALPLPTLIQSQTDKLIALDSNYNDAIQMDVAYMSTTFQADNDSRIILTQSLAPGSVPAGFYWLDINNVRVTMTYAQLQGLGLAMLVQGQTAFDKLRTLKNQVQAATTTAAVQAIVW
jgi:hypothetical protein